MLSKKESYICLSAMLHAREPKLLNEERANRMLDAASYEDAAKLLADCGYPDLSQCNAAGIESALSEHRAEICSELQRLVPDPEILDLFRMKYDYHNAKVLLKAEAMGVAGDRLLSGAGRIPAKDLKELYHAEKYSSMPGSLGKAVEEAKAVLAHTANPQEADFLLDRSYFRELSALSAETGNAFLQGYVRLLIDAANLKSYVRTLRMGKDRSFMASALIPGGSVTEDRLLAAGDKDALLALFTCSRLEKAAALGADAMAGAALTPFELECDNAVNSYLRQAKMINYGSEPLTAYLAAVENEITAIRMILTGRLAGIQADVIRERLRELYA